MKPFNQESIIDALRDLSNRLEAKGIKGEICIFGGAAMILAYRSRQSTKDIDAIFQPTAPMRESINQIGRDKGLPDGWLNDGVKGFVSNAGKHTTEPLQQFPALRVLMPVPEYLLAMKCMAARVGETDATDTMDTQFLIEKLGLKSPGAVFDIVEQYYPRNRITPRTQYFVESLFDEQD